MENMSNQIYEVLDEILQQDQPELPKSVSNRLILAAIVDLHKRTKIDLARGKKRMNKIESRVWGLVIGELTLLTGIILKTIFF
jgi:hypothetical protein